MDLWIDTFSAPDCGRVGSTFAIAFGTNTGPRATSNPPRSIGETSNRFGGGFLGPTALRIFSIRRMGRCPGRPICISGRGGLARPRVAVRTCLALGILMLGTVRTERAADALALLRMFSLTSRPLASLPNLVTWSSCSLSGTYRRPIPAAVAFALSAFLYSAGVEGGSGAASLSAAFSRMFLT